MENRVDFGLKNVHIAPVTDDGTKLVYEKPWAQKGAVEMSLDPAGESVQFEADDNANYYTAESNNGYSGKFTIATASEQFRTEILGEEYDDNGNLVESDKPSKPFGMLFEFDGDQNATRYALFNVTVKRPSVGSKTKGSKTEVNTKEFEFTAALNPYTNTPKMTTSSKTLPAAYASWYDTFPEPSFTKESGEETAPTQPAEA